MSQDKPYRQGVGIVLLNSEGLVFAGCRADREEEAWQLPQGGMEPGESPASAACRELTEEIGTDKAEVVAVLQTVTRYDYPPEATDTERGRLYRGQEHRWVVMRFTVPVLLHVAQRNRLEPGTGVTLTLRAEGIHLLKGD